MILTIDGDLKPYYAQTLCMIFFPGAKFPREEAESPDSPAVHFRVQRMELGFYAEVTISLYGKTESRSHFSLFENGLDEMRTAQIAAGTAFFEAASFLTQIRPPWGILTGVRPAKIASEQFRRGKSSAETAAWISDHYLTTLSKARLATMVAESERRLITPDLTGKCSVYIGIPFCPSRCAYCSFVSYTSDRLLRLIPEYLQALRSNIHTVFHTIRTLGLEVSTIYIGGGTPTVLDENQLAFLLKTVSEETDVSALCEFTLEAGRPDTITQGKLSIAKSFGISRISVNTQTLNEDILASIGRRHTAKQFFEAYDLAVRSGIRHINVDLIAGLPEESAESFCRSLDQILELSPDNITVHTFSVKKAAEIRQEKETVYDSRGAAAREAVEYSQRILPDRGYFPYYMYRQKNTVGNLENVGYAKPGAEGLYNIYMMEEVHSIFAAGASAVTKFVSPMDTHGNNHIDRIFEVKYPYEYLKNYNSTSETVRAEEYCAAAQAFYSQFF